MKHFKKVNEETFNKIKSLLDVGLSWKEIKDLSFVPKNNRTRHSIDDSETFEKFQESIKSKSVKNSKQVTPDAIPQSASLDTIVRALVEMKVSVDNLCNLIAAAGKSNKFKIW
jgi:hypothetical protein